MDERELSAFSTGGTVPGSTGAAAGIPPTGGGMAVPSDATLMDGGGTPIGDTASMDDSGVPNAPQEEDDTSVQEAAGDVNTLTGGTYAMPQASDDKDERNGDADAPTGGLSQTGTIGGTPAGATESGMGGSGL